MSMKDQKQIEQVRRLFAALNLSAYTLSPQQPPYADVLAVNSNRRIYIEVTDFHSDENCRGGSKLRNKVEKELKMGNVNSHWVSPDPHPGLFYRISEKAEKHYDRLHATDEIWLAIFAGVPQLAVIPTMLITPFLRCLQLTTQTKSLLEASQFSRCYIFCELNESGNSKLYAWCRGGSWMEAS